MKKISSLLILALVGALLAGAMFTLQLMKRPLDAPLELTLPAAEVQPAAQAQGNQKTCGESGTMALLVSGLSMPEWRPVHGVGAVRLVKVDFDNQSVAVLNVPRALFVANTNLPTPAETALTVVYRMARDAAKGNNPQEINRKATQDMAQVLVDEFGYVPDHYITVDPARFVELVDSLEGINVTLSAEVDGTPDELGTFPGGAQQLDGAQALELLRILHPAGVSDPSVWQKFERQRVVTLGLLGAMLQPANWDKLPEAAKEARQMVVTDLSVNQVLDLACMVKEAGEATTFEDVPAGMVQQVSDEEVRMVDEEAVKALIGGYGSEKK